MKTKFIALIIGLGLVSSVWAETAQEKTLPPSPQALVSQLKSSLPNVRPSCVSLDRGGYFSGVIISPEGFILTAAHTMRTLKEDQKISVTLPDGRTATADVLGFNRESDLALLQITSPSGQSWPYCQVADKTLGVGGFCFTVAHPAGILSGRPAQVRMGRITSLVMNEGIPSLLFADCNIQPGDSGGPLFSLDGKLIGIDSSAANILGFNFFPAIDQWHLDQARLKKGERWGDSKKAPDGETFSNLSISKESMPAIQQEFARRLQVQYPPSLNLIQSRINNGTVEIDMDTILHHMAPTAIALSRNQAISLGLDDPDIVKQLPPLPKKPKALSLYANEQKIAYGLAIDMQHIITKSSRIPKDTILSLQFGGETLLLTLVTKNPEWDLAIFKLPKTMPLPTIRWPEEMTPIKAGDLLMAHGLLDLPTWNIATDEAREVSKKRSVGPLSDQSVISKHRAPYPLAIRHALALHASDAGKPVFNESGEFVGMHIARFSRTVGLLVPTEQLKQQISRMMKAPTTTD